MGLIDTIRDWAPACRARNARSWTTYRAGWNRSRSPARESAWGTSSAAWPPATLAGSHWQSGSADSTFWFLFDGVADPPAAGIAGRVVAGAGLPGGTEVLKMRGGVRVGLRFCSDPAPPSWGKRLEARARRSASAETRRGRGLSREGASPTRLFLLYVNQTDFIPESRFADRTTWPNSISC